MKKTVLLFTAVLLICCSLCSCIDDSKIEFEKVENKESKGVSSVSSETKDEIEFTAEIADEDFLASTKDYHFFNANGENYVSILYKTSQTVTNIELFKIRLGDSGKYKKDEVVYTLGELSPDKHLVASTLIVGTTPQMGISFTDVDGVTYNYSINKKADNRIVLTKLEFEETEQNSK